MSKRIMEEILELKRKKKKDSKSMNKIENYILQVII
jgi:hypothetical protein